MFLPSACRLAANGNSLAARQKPYPFSSRVADQPISTEVFSLSFSCCPVFGELQAELKWKRAESGGRKENGGLLLVTLPVTLIVVSDSLMPARALTVLKAL